MDSRVESSSNSHKINFNMYEKSQALSTTTGSPQYSKMLPYIFKIQNTYLPILPFWNPKESFFGGQQMKALSIKQESFQRKDSHQTQTNSESINSQKKGCNCRKSKCLKQYCDCFAAGRECGSSCQCCDCFNQHKFNDLRDKAMQSILNRDPKAFSNKIEEVLTKKVHNRGCNCRRSGCTKKYCECYQAGTGCGPYCKCSGCLNCDTHEQIRSFGTSVEPIFKKICLKF